MARKKKRVPEVLWRLFGSRARTLADTILSFIPPPPSAAAGCRCKGRRCLFCSGGEAMSFLVRPDDPPDYRKLLTKCYVVVSENSPPHPVFDPHCRWSQPEIVRTCIEMIMHEEPSSSNLICCSYDKETCSSDVVDTLTSPNWRVLLKRVGDSLMMYLLKYTSLFIPLDQMKHHQITGDPVNNLFFKFSGCMPNSDAQPHPVAQNGSRKSKRKMVEVVDPVPKKKLHTYSLVSQPSSNSVRSTEGNGSRCVSTGKLSPTKCEGSTKQNTVSSHKRTRQFRWQRQRKRRQLVVQGTHPLIPCKTNGRNIDCLSMELQDGIHTSSTKSDKGNISHCFCCSVFQNEPKLKRNAEVYSRNILYKLENSTEMFPRNHILYALESNVSGASTLFNVIFGIFGNDKNTEAIPCCSRKSSSPVTLNCLYHTLIKLLKHLIHGTHNCRDLRLLDKHCPIRSSYQDESMVSEAGFEYYCPKKDVVSFVWAICRRIVPSQLLGDHCNWRILRKNIAKFIHLRKFEKFSLKECIHKLKISKFPLLSNKNRTNMHNVCSELGITDTARHAILGCWIFWFFTSLVYPLLQANFYITESQHEKQEVLYYRKSTWQKLTREAECMNNEMYRLLNLASVSKIVENRSFGFSQARLLPKQNGFRMLSNLRAPSRMPPFRIHPNQRLQRKAFCNRPVKHQFFKSVNNVLHDVHVVLKGLITKEPEKLGSSVFDYNDVYKKLMPFLFLLKNRSSNMPRVFIVVSDVSKAFDSVDQDKLLSVMNDVLLDDEYTLKKLTQVFCTNNSLKVCQHLTLADTVSAKITPRLPAQSLDSILVKMAPSGKIRKEEINATLEEHITRNVVRLGNKFYLQRVGIPQGSVLSTLLCSYYYGHMERNSIYPFIEKVNERLLRGYDDTNGVSTSRGNDNSKEMFACGSEYILLRFIDDFLFISTSEKQASVFFSRLERGFRAYNCCMNKEKYGLNFNMENGQECRSNRLYVGKDGVSFLPWSGLFVNCSTLEIQADYTRYLNSHLRSTLTVSCQGKVGSQLKSKLRTYMRPKCHPIFFDSNINSLGVVKLNIYQMFLLGAMKFVCHISNLSILPKFTKKFLTDAIYSSIRSTSSLIKRKMRSFRGVDTGSRPKYLVRKEVVVWLGLYAYSRVLKKKQSKYKNLLPFFRSKLKAYGKIENMSSALKYAIDDAHSSVLWSIKY